MVVVVVGMPGVKPARPSGACVAAKPAAAGAAPKPAAAGAAPNPEGEAPMVEPMSAALAALPCVFIVEVGSIGCAPVKSIGAGAVVAPRVVVAAAAEASTSFSEELKFRKSRASQPLNVAAIALDAINMAIRFATIMAQIH